MWPQTKSSLRAFAFARSLITLTCNNVALMKKKKKRTEPSVHPFPLPSPHNITCRGLITKEALKITNVGVKPSLTC